MAAIPSPVQGEQRPVTALRGVGAALAERLAKLGVTQVQDLLFVLPSRYEDRTHVESIGTLIPGSRVVVEGEVLLTEITFRRRRQMLCRISDGSGFLTLRFFYFSAAQQNGLARGTRIRCFGEVRRGPFGLEIVHPEYRRVTDSAPAALEETLDADLSVNGGCSAGPAARARQRGVARVGCCRRARLDPGRCCGVAGSALAARQLWSTCIVRLARPRFRCWRQAAIRHNGACHSRNC